ncbi:MULTISPECIES: fatty-acid--CoA ligase [unclassified Mycobacterium]|uniref:fatty-acid--CoA ligase n=1 Tax=unclassified Mycobacterium TaxID=2642494 RepID=UPI0029C78A5E|nr:MULTISPECIES: fatty-acid--CoA ligase [unclassified Mycobacterium]
MTRRTMRPYVLAANFRVAQPDRVWTVLQRYSESLVDVGADYVCLFRSTLDPQRVLVTIGIHTEQPILNQSRSPYLLDWFDAMGVDDVPAVFIGRSVDRFEIGGDPTSPAPTIVVAAVTPVDDVVTFVNHVRRSTDEFRAAGIQRTLVYRAFDDDGEVMFLQQLVDKDHAQRWAQRSDVAAEWLAQAGIGAYPPVFVGELQHIVRFPDSSWTESRR